MLISPIINNNILYINLHAEQTFFGSFHADQLNVSENIITGIYTDELLPSVLAEILKFLQEKKGKFKILVLDFQKLVTAHPRSFESINIIRNECKSLVLKNIDSRLINKLNLNDCNEYFGNNPKALLHDEFLLDEDSTGLRGITQKTKTVFDIEFKNILKEINFETPEKKIHHSSSVYLNKFIDCKSLVVNHKQFFLYTCYWLAIEMSEDKRPQRNWFVEKGSKKTLLCQNLNSSLLSSVLSSFLLIDVITLDHIGPINKVYNEVEKKINHGEEYIVVADVVCLGTEVRIAKNIIEFSGGRYLGNVALIRILTMEAAEKYRDVESVYEITKDNNPIKFKVTTALD